MARKDAEGKGVRGGLFSGRFPAAGSKCEECWWGLRGWHEKKPWIPLLA
jgi:hypothetical protein